MIIYFGKSQRLVLLRTLRKKKGRTRCLGKSAVHHKTFVDLAGDFLFAIDRWRHARAHDGEYFLERQGSTHGTGDQSLAAALQCASGKPLLFQRTCYEVQKNCLFLPWLHLCRMITTLLRATGAECFD